MTPLLLLSVVLGSPPQAGGDQPSDVKYSEIVQGLRDAESLLESFSLTAHIEVERNEPQRRWIKSLDADYTLDKNGRISYEAVQQIQEAGKVVATEKLRYSYDGAKLTGLLGNERKYGFGHLSKNPSAVPWLIDPREFLTSFHSQPVSKFLEANEGHVAGTSTWDGRKVVVLETKTNQLKWDRRKYQLLVDCGRNFAVVRRSIRSQSAEGKAWFDYFRLEGSGYVETNGVWVPTKVKREEYLLRKDGEPELLSRVSLEGPKWRINPPVSDMSFQTKFPANVYVNDEITGKNYRALQITDKSLLDQASQAEELLETPEPERRSGRPPRSYTLAALGALSLAVLAALAVVRAKRKGV
jgi:hypothetical protein